MILFESYLCARWTQRRSLHHFGLLIWSRLAFPEEPKDECVFCLFHFFRCTSVAFHVRRKPWESSDFMTIHNWFAKTVRRVMRIGRGWWHDWKMWLPCRRVHDCRAFATSNFILDNFTCNALIWSPVLTCLPLIIDVANLFLFFATNLIESINNLCLLSCDWSTACLDVRQRILIFACIFISINSCDNSPINPCRSSITFFNSTYISVVYSSLPTFWQLSVQPWDRVEAFFKEFYLQSGPFCSST